VGVERQAEVECLTSSVYFTPQCLAIEEDDGNFWLFIDIPMTAGSSHAAEISRELRPYCNIHVEYDDNGFICLGSAASDMRSVRSWHL
jgi:hypothetical protein